MIVSFFCCALLAVYATVYEILGKEVIGMIHSKTPKGQGLVEYALILVLVAIVVFAVLMVLGPVIGNTFSSINQSLSSL